MKLQDRVTELVKQHLDQEPLEDGSGHFLGQSIQLVNTTDGDSPGCARFIVEIDGEPQAQEVLVLVTTFGRE